MPDGAALSALDPLAGARPWLTRQAGECAFPVGGAGTSLRACCAPCGAASYCAAHAVRMRGPPAPDGEDLIRGLAHLLDPDIPDPRIPH